jgi:hypothetical protein
MDNVGSQDERRKQENEKHHLHKQKKYFGFGFRNSHILSSSKQYKNSFLKYYKKEK